MPTTLSDRYRLITMIGGGGMGEVWRAHDEVLRREVAVKIIRPHLADDDTVRERLRVEARLAGSLNHPGIVDVFDYGEHDDDGQTVPYLVMPLVDGSPLSAVIAERGSISTGETMAMVSEVAAALQAAHDAGIVHRDLKPGNILLTPDGRAMLVDFGIAHGAGGEPLTRTGTLIGTADYLSPEQASGSSVTFASDLYALGVVAFVCLTGTLPFHRDTEVATALAHIQAEIPPLPDTVPPGAVALVHRLLEKSAADRPASAAEVAEAASHLATSVPLPIGVTPDLEGPETVLDAAVRPDATLPGIVERAVPVGTAATAAFAAPSATGASELAASVAARDRPPRRVVLLSSAVVVVIALLGAWMLMKGPDGVAVPDLTGKSQSTARRLLDERGLTMKVKKVDVARRTAGEVVSQDPGPGTPVDRGSSVTVSVASGYVSVPLDRLEGSTYDEGATLLDGLGLTAARVDVLSSEPAGTVIGADPSDRARAGSTVRLTVSNGLGAASAEPDKPDKPAKGKDTTKDKGRGTSKEKPKGKDASGGSTSAPTPTTPAPSASPSPAA